METAKNIYYQTKNRTYVKNNFGKEIWIQVSGHRELNSADAGFWGGFYPIRKIERNIS